MRSHRWSKQLGAVGAGLGLSAVALLVTTCFDPTYPPGHPCGEDDWCPPGQRCQQGLCVLPGMPLPPADAAPVDAAPVDGPPVANDVADLSALLPSAGQLSPAFDPEQTSYELSVSALVSELSVRPTSVHPAATIRVDGATVASGTGSTPRPLTDTGVQISIEVMAPAGNSRSYTVSVTRDAAIAQELYAKASNPGSGDDYGFGLAVGAKVLAVGAPLEDSIATGLDGNQGSDGRPDSGAAYIYRRVAGAWQQQAYAKAEVGDESAEFGLFLAVDGDTVAVSVFGDDSGVGGVDGDPADETAPDSGAVYVFRDTGGSWVQEAYLKAFDPDPGDRFGLRIALEGDVLVVGAPEEDAASAADQGDNSLENSGAVYVFRRTGETWAQEAFLKAEQPGAGDQFGYSVGVAGDILVVGARDEDSNATDVDGDVMSDAAPNSGAAYVFRRSGQDWVQEAYLKASNTGAGDEFGYRVAASTELVAVGARYEDSDGAGVDPPDNDLATDSGAAYVFGYDDANGEWVPRARLKASNTGNFDWFGHGISAHGDLVAVGAPHNASRGAVYVFRCNPGCANIADLTASNADEDDNFGFTVSLGPDSLAVGAPFEDSDAAGLDGDQDNNGRDESGAVYLFR
ncbi:cadherin-like beta sandwich domain-containing protein [Haliangium sp.]|uniref:cadherin-like beta sandwich domain-containing protein n=1 Tax=Haliangium sp. TaxID=2663208 RepID=UPI003D119B3A